MTPEQKQKLDKARELLLLATLDNYPTTRHNALDELSNMSVRLAALADTLARRVEVLEGALDEILECQRRNYGNGLMLHIEMIALSSRARAALSATQPKEPRT